MPVRTLLIGSALLPCAAMAQTADGGTPQLPYTPPHFGFVVQAGLDYGGDKLVTVHYYDRYYDYDEDVRAGTGISAAAGVHFKPSLYSPVDVRLTAGYKYDGTYSRDANIYFDRITAELVGDYRFYKGFFAGAGVIEHFNPKLHGDGYAPDIRFGNATGFTVEAGWRFVALSYHYINYKADGYDGHADGSSIGVLFKYGF